MIIGVPREIKSGEGRVALTPQDAKKLTGAGHLVRVETLAGEKSGFPDSAYKRAKSKLTNREEAWSADLILKVKEPLREEFQFFENGKAICAFFHLAANPDLLGELKKAKVTAVDYGTIERPDESPHILAAMSKIAGRIAYFDAAELLKKYRGDLAGPKTNIAVIGMGNAGIEAANLFLAAGARVAAIDSNPKKISFLRNMFHAFSPYQCQLWHINDNQEQLAALVRNADILIGAVHIPGMGAKKLVTAQMMRSMKPYAIAVDIAIDQGGCFETSRPTTIDSPIFVKHGVIHYCVANMPGSVPATATPALTEEALPYVIEIAQKGIRQALLENPALAQGINTYKGKLTHRGPAEALRRRYTQLKSLL